MSQLLESPLLSSPSTFVDRRNPAAVERMAICEHGNLATRTTAFRPMPPSWLRPSINTSCTTAAASSPLKRCYRW